MGPHRIIHNRRGYLTETYYDEVSGSFGERPFPPTVAMAPPPPSIATDRPSLALHEADLHGLAHDLDAAQGGQIWTPIGGQVCAPIDNPGPHASPKGDFADTRAR